MNFNTNIPGLKDVIVEKIEEIGERTVLYVTLPIKTHKCPQCNENTIKVHDYRLQKVKHFEMVERLTTLFYRRRPMLVNVGSVSLRNALS